MITITAVQPECPTKTLDERPRRHRLRRQPSLMPRLLSSRAGVSICVAKGRRLVFATVSAPRAALPVGAAAPRRGIRRGLR